MKPETKREVERIVNQGWYRKSQAFGEGGWGYFAKLTNHNHDWKQYILWGIECQSWAEIEKISAKDDETAIKAFHSLYHLEDFDEWDIQEVVTEYRLVDTSDKGE